MKEAVEDSSVLGHESDKGSGNLGKKHVRTDVDDSVGRLEWMKTHLQVVPDQHSQANEHLMMEREKIKDLGYCLKAPNDDNRGTSSLPIENANNVFLMATAMCATMAM